MEIIPLQPLLSAGTQQSVGRAAALRRKKKNFIDPKVGME